MTENEERLQTQPEPDTQSSEFICVKAGFTRDSAKRAIAKAKKSKSRARNECRYYFCDKCQSFHLTHKRAYDNRDKEWQLQSRRAIRVSLQNKKRANQHWEDEINFGFV